jgi:hypothetical protein
MPPSASARPESAPLDPELVLEPPELVLEPLELVLEPLELVLEPLELVLEPPELVLVAPEPVVALPEFELVSPVLAPPVLESVPELSFVAPSSNAAPGEVSLEPLEQPSAAATAIIAAPARDAGWALKTTERQERLLVLLARFTPKPYCVRLYSRYLSTSSHRD